MLGADSTSTYIFPGNDHHFNYGQKLFEIGEESTFGIVTWGLGGLGLGSYRTLIARLADDLKATPPNSALEVATRWTDIVWQPYSLTLSQHKFSFAKFSVQNPPLYGAYPVPRQVRVLNRKKPCSLISRQTWWRDSALEGTSKKTATQWRLKWSLIRC